MKPSAKPCLSSRAECEVTGQRQRWSQAVRAVACAHFQCPNKLGEVDRLARQRHPDAVTADCMRQAQILLHIRSKLTLKLFQQMAARHRPDLEASGHFAILPYYPTPYHEEAFLDAYVVDEALHRQPGIRPLA